MSKLYKPTVTALGVLMLALLMHCLREEAFCSPVQLVAPVLLFAIGIVLSKLLKPVLE